GVALALTINTDALALMALGLINA
ncbi:unnamed protein product, partial [Rotaria sordida]